MKKFRFILFLLTVLGLAALACSGGSSPTAAPEAQPTSAPQIIVVTATPEEAPATEAPATEPAASESSGGEFSGGSSELVTFTDSNNLFSFDLPGDWNYSNSFNEEDGIYVDRFESPDTTGFIENITGFNNEPISGKLNGKLALYFIHKYYSNTGKEGDISISSDQIQKDGSERLEWTSKSGGYSGVTFFEVRGSDRKTFLMLTAWWSSATPDAVFDQINGAITSYRVP